ncbi:MAG: DNA integrity scanning diadenylate cyclase DisA [Desulfosarcinaceae bacterium]
MIDAQMTPRIQMVAPGTRLRRALDDIVMAEFGALVVFLDDIKAQENILQGGFYIGASFSPEKLYELAKMDGAIILDEAVSRILAANVQLAPDPTIPTDETGMRHRAAERVARQTGKFVLTVSRRRRVITLYYNHLKHQMNEIGYLITRLDQTIRTVERYKLRLDKKVSLLESDEFMDQVQLVQVIELIQNGVEILRLLEEAAPYVVETGVEGRLPAMRLASVGEDVNEMIHLLVKDYCPQRCLESDGAEMVADLKREEGGGLTRIARHLGWASVGEADLHDIVVSPRGYRMLKQVAKIPLATADQVVARFKSLSHLSRADEASLMEVEGIGEKRAQSIIAGIGRMRNRSAYR